MVMPSNNLVKNRINYIIDMKNLTIGESQVTLKEARARIANYLAKKSEFQLDLEALVAEKMTRVEFYEKYVQKQADFLRAFTIPGADFIELAKMEGVKDVRAYLGQKEGATQPCLLLCGVDEANADIVDSEAKQLGTSGVFDFTNPCPIVCDTKSELYVEVIY